MKTTIHSNTIQNFERLIKKQRLTYQISELLRVGSIFLLIVLVSVLFEMIFRFSANIRTGIVVFLATAFFAIFVKYVVLASINYFKSVELKEIIEFSIKIGNENPAIKDELTNAIEISNSAAEGFSKDLIFAAFNSVLQKIEFSKLEKSISINANSIKFSVLSLLIFLTFLLILPDFNSGLNRIIFFSQEFKSEVAFEFVVNISKKEIVKGNSLQIEIFVKGKAIQEISFLKKNKSDILFSQKAIQVSNNYALVMFHQVEETFDFYLKSEETISDTFTVKVVDKPFVKNLEITVFPPNYTNLSPQNYSNEAEIFALHGSKIQAQVLANKQLSNAELVINDSIKSKMQVDGNRANINFGFRNSVEYHFDLYDKNDEKSVNPIKYSIVDKSDLFPEIELVFPQKNVELATEKSIMIHFKINDDFGFSRLELKYFLSNSDFKPIWDEVKSIKIPFAKRNLSQEITFNWDFSQMKFETDDVYTFYVEIFDNDEVLGPKSSKSKAIKIHLPSLEELLNKSEKEQKENFKNLEETLKEAIDLKKEMEKLSLDLKKNEEKLNWEEQSELKKTAEKLENLVKQSEEIKHKIAKEQKNLEKNNVLSENTMEKYNQLHELMKQLNNEELMKALEKMNQNLENMMREDAQKSLEELKKDEEAFRKSLERTIGLFKRILAEQKMDEISKRIDEIQKLQEEVKNDLKSGKSDVMEEMKKQNEITKKIQDLQKEMEKLNDLGKEIDDFPKKESENLQKEMKSQKNDEKSLKAMEQIMTENFEFAENEQTQIMENMQNSSQQLSNMQMMMSQQNQADVLAKLLNLTSELVETSFNQEELANDNSGLNEVQNNSNINKSTKEQNQLAENVNQITQKLNSLSQKTFAITPEMANSIGSAKREMNQAINSLQDGNNGKAKKHQNSAVQMLNDAANQMQAMMNNLANQQSQGGGMMSLSQQLKQMAGQQMQINKSTSQMQQMGENGMKMGQMQKLANQQSALQKSLEELKKEATESGVSKKIPANLEKIAEEMNEVVRGLKSQKVDDELIKSQEKILSRMLEAQRSINERDFEQHRESFSGKENARKSPSEVDEKMKMSENKLDKELQRALKSGFKKDYEEIIREYYKKLKSK